MPNPTWNGQNLTLDLASLYGTMDPQERKATVHISLSGPVPVQVVITPFLSGTGAALVLQNCTPAPPGSAIQLNPGDVATINLLQHEVYQIRPQYGPGRTCQMPPGFVALPNTVFQYQQPDPPDSQSNNDHLEMSTWNFFDPLGGSQVIITIEIEDDVSGGKPTNTVRVRRNTRMPYHDDMIRIPPELLFRRKIPKPISDGIPGSIRRKVNRSLKTKTLKPRTPRSKTK